jgi:hypothetical protein
MFSAKVLGSFSLPGNYFIEKNRKLLKYLQPTTNSIFCSFVVVVLLTIISEERLRN